MRAVFGRMNDFDPVNLAEGLDGSAVIAQRHHLVETEHVAAIFDIVHLDFH